VLVSHPLISLAIQFHATPGKKGRPRQKVGNVDRAVHPYGITIPCAAPGVMLDDSGERVAWSVTPLFDARFDMGKFRRALHHVAFNLTAAIKGPDAMLDGRYDEARRYIRYARRGEAWPYGRYVVSLETIDRAMFGGLFDTQESDEEYVALRLFQTAFFVDLLHLGALSEFLESQQPPGTVLVDSSYEVPTYESSGRRQYRFTIVLDEDHPDRQALHSNKR
jgi:hypothetical protein